MPKLSEKEADEARQRALAYEHSMAIEGIELTPEEKELMAFVDRERMGYEEGVQYGIKWLRDRGIIPELNKAAE